MVVIHLIGVETLVRLMIVIYIVSRLVLYIRNYQLNEIKLIQTKDKVHICSNVAINLIFNKRDRAVY